MIPNAEINEWLGYALLAALGVAYAVLYIRARRRDKGFRVWKWVLQAMADCITEKEQL